MKSKFEQLENEKHPFRSLVDNLPDNIVRYDREGRTIYVNSTLEKTLGFPASEMIGTRIRELNPDGSYEDYAQAVDDALASGENSEFELVVPDGTGKTIHQIRIVAEHDEQGEVSGVLAIGRDISERKHAEEELRRSESDLIEAQRIAKLGSWHLNLATNEVTWSEELYRMCDCDPTQPPPDYDVSSQLYTADSWDRLTAAMTQTVETGIPYELELEMVQKNGPNKWIWARGELERDADGNPVVVRGVALDITERKRAEQAARQNEEALNEAQRIAHMGSWHLDLATNEVRWSEELYRIYGFELTQRVPNYDETAKLFKEESWERLGTEIARTLETGDPYEIEMEMITTSGKEKWVQARGELVRDAEGKPVELRGTLMDITDMHEVEEQLRQAQKMESVGILVGGIAHDFNNKLAAIIGNIYLAQANINANSEVAEKLKIIEKLSFEAAEMIKQLLIFSRNERVEQAGLSLTSFIKENIKLNQVAIPENIHLSMNYDNRPLVVMGDTTQLQQLLLNLLNNARDAVREKEDAHIEVSLLEYHPDAPFYRKHPNAGTSETYACLKVKDNGCGVPREHIDKIFDPFFTTKPVGSGTGLGLAMVYGIVQSHDGIIEVESEPDSGCTVSVYFPLHEDNKEEKSIDQKAEVLKGEGETILIADDDEHVLQIFQDLLSSMNYRALIARDGKEAVALFQQHKSEIDLVILDIIMPGFKGPEVARRIREIVPDVKLIFVSGYDDNQVSDSESGMTDKVLRKPFDIVQVSLELRQILDK